MTHGWQQDVLGPDWVARTLDLPGGDTATLVRKAGAPLPDGAAPAGARPTSAAPTPGQAPATRSPTSPATGAVPAEGERRRRAVLYVHGFVDYFFQTHLADAFEEHGYTFYAIDLRGYGRSLAHWTEAGKDPNMVTDLSLHAQDLDAAAAVVRDEGTTSSWSSATRRAASSRACGPTRGPVRSRPSSSTARGSTSTRPGSTAWSPRG